MEVYSLKLLSYRWLYKDLARSFLLKIILKMVSHIRQEVQHDEMSVYQYLEIWNVPRFETAQDNCVLHETPVC